MHQHVPRVCIIYFSLSGQSRGLINLLAAGIRSQGGEVMLEQIVAVKRIGFPFNSILKTLLMMVLTFFRKRITIQPPSEACYQQWDVYVLAGPTWSYNPSGPVLDLFDRFGSSLFKGKTVIPLISCRGYHRLHERVMSRMLEWCGAGAEEALVVKHPVAEPWSTIGVFLRSAGYRPDRIPYVRSRYRHFGHSVDQLLEIKEKGARMCERLRQENG